ncbi:MAG: LOG family protein [Alphaproteobacteria bacterium]|nr:LOG family protein [Alphaproteobacteria bacterium]
MSEDTTEPEKAYTKLSFLHSKDARPMRILAEYLEPLSRFDRHRIDDTVVFMGSARTPSRDDAEEALAVAEETGVGVAEAEMQLRMAEYYEDARVLAHRLTTWSKGLDDKDLRFVVCTGGGPGIMEAANRGASEAKGVNVGLTISLETEEPGNQYITRELAVHFHYFFMRKFWFAYQAKAVVLFPGGFGTCDELFEILTLLQTGKIRKHLPVVLYGTDFWDKVINFEALVEMGTISRGDLDLFYRCDSVDDAYDYIVGELTAHAMGMPGAVL